MSLRASARSPALIVTVGTRAFAIPLQYVAETMRPLAIEPISGTPKFVRGVALIRGEPIPIVDLKVLLEDGENSAEYGRFVTLKVGERRRVALAVEGVVGLKELDWAQIAELPPLLRDIGADVVEAIGTCDAQLLIVVRAARIVPDDLWATLATGTEAK